MFNPTPYQKDELWDTFHQEGTFTKHLLTIYSIAMGLNARSILDIGIGSTTKALRLAARETGGVVYSCDVDKKRYSSLLDNEEDDWKLFLGTSEDFLAQIKEPVDFVMHDGSHEYTQVKLDLELIFPLVKKYGIICVHDTQQVDCGKDIMAAIRDAARDRKISITTLPYNCGLSIIRMEDGDLAEIEPTKKLLKQGTGYDTLPLSFPSYLAEQDKHSATGQSLVSRLRFHVRKMILGA